ncbi:MAG: S-layer homology domain-containing protein [Oscillospiraceae bacterium]|nr:S-layer homology domain-containing protein [Oscillospiraceae bacterium]
MNVYRWTAGLALAVILTCLLLVPRAGAVSDFDRFRDKTEIVNREAVSKLTELGIISGTESGYFNPTGLVTRAEMAKMIAMVMNPNQVINSSSKQTELIDIEGHWAAEYIHYCYRLGIIAGRGNNRFDPDANVTADEAAKMLLVAAGYDPIRKKFTGQDWVIHVSDVAVRMGIYNDFTKAASDPISRDDAALLIYNALIG